MSEILERLLGGVGTAAGLALAARGYKDVGDIGREAFERMSTGFTDDSGQFTEGLAGMLDKRFEFQPYTVTTATGGQFGMTQDPETKQMTYDIQTSPDEQNLQEEQLRRAGMFFNLAETDTTQREQDIYNRMRAAQAPEEERQRLALEQRLANQGRLGVRTSMFGGTPEQLALAQAQEEAKNKAMLTALEFAGQEQQRQAQLGTGMLAAGYVPQAQLLSGLQPGITAAEQRRQAMAQQAGAFGETYATGLEALLQSALGQANIAGMVGGSIATESLGGLFS